VTLAAMRERIGLDVELFDAGELHGELNNIASPVQYLRDIFDVMPTATVEDWSNIASRLTALPEAAAGYGESLRYAAAQGHVAAARQVELCVAEAQGLASSSSFFTELVTGEEASAVLAGEPALRAELERGAQAAATAYGQLSELLAHEIAPHAPASDAAGRDRYALWSRYFLGSAIDLEETYAWGLEELARVTAEQEKVAAQ